VVCASGIQNIGPIGGPNRRQYADCSARTLLTVNGYAVAVFV
jgi:hypothetical protein